MAYIFLQEPHGIVISQKIAFFIVAAVKIANLAAKNLFRYS
jgi:hypothetical protein